MNYAEKLKAKHEAQAILSKDFSINEIFMGAEKAIKKGYKVVDNSVVLEVTSVLMKYVPKYDKVSQGKEGGTGNHITFILKDETVTGNFSEASKEFAMFLINESGADVTKHFNKVTFRNAKGDPTAIKVRVTKIALANSKSTYQFGLLESDVDKIVNEDE